MIGQSSIALHFSNVSIRFLHVLGMTSLFEGLNLVSFLKAEFMLITPSGICGISTRDLQPWKIFPISLSFDGRFVILTSFLQSLNVFSIFTTSSGMFSTFSREVHPANMAFMFWPSTVSTVLLPYISSTPGSSSALYTVESAIDFILPSTLL